MMKQGKANNIEYIQNFNFIHWEFGVQNCIFNTPKLDINDKLYSI